MNYIYSILLLFVFTNAAHANAFQHPFFITHTGLWDGVVEMTSTHNNEVMRGKSSWEGKLEPQGKIFTIKGNLRESPIGQYSFTYLITKKDGKYEVTYRDSKGNEKQYSLKLTSDTSFKMIEFFPSGKKKIVRKGECNMNTIKTTSVYMNQKGVITHKAKSFCTKRAD